MHMGCGFVWLTEEDNLDAFRERKRLKADAIRLALVESMKKGADTNVDGRNLALNISTQTRTLVDKEREGHLTRW